MFILTYSVPFLLVTQRTSLCLTICFFYNLNRKVNDSTIFKSVMLEGLKSCVSRHFWQSWNPPSSMGDGPQGHSSDLVLYCHHCHCNPSCYYFYHLKDILMWLAKKKWAKKSNYLNYCIVQWITEVQLWMQTWHV